MKKNHIYTCLILAFFIPHYAVGAGAGTTPAAVPAQEEIQRVFEWHIGRSTITLHIRPTDTAKDIKNMVIQGFRLVGFAPDGVEVRLNGETLEEWEAEGKLWQQLHNYIGNNGKIHCIPLHW